MSEKDEDPKEGSRREFFLIGCSAVGLASAGFVVSTFRYLVPTVLYEPPARFTVGNPDQFPPGSVTFLADRRVFLFHGPDGFFAISSICTHLGCNVKRTKVGFACPCHGSRFDKNGRVVPTLTTEIPPESEQGATPIFGAFLWSHQSTRTAWAQSWWLSRSFGV